MREAFGYRCELCNFYCPMVTDERDIRLIIKMQQFKDGLIVLGEDQVFVNFGEFSDGCARG